MNKKFAGLIIMDGYGLAPASASNSVSLAKKPFLDKLFQEYPNNVLQASGEDVGLPEGQMGNSEVGHLIPNPCASPGTRSTTPFSATCRTNFSF